MESRIEHTKSTDYQLDRKNHQEKYRWVILCLNAVLQTLHSCIVVAAGTLAPFLSIDLGLTKSMLGIAGGAVNIGTSLTSFFAGRLADKKGDKFVLVTGSILTGIAFIIASGADSFILILLLLFITGICASAPMPVGSRAISKWFPPSQLGFALSIRQTGVPLGGFLAALLLPFVAEKAGWRMAFVSAGLLLIIGGIVCKLAYKDKPQSLLNYDIQLEQKENVGKWDFFYNSNIWRCFFTAVVLVGTQYTMISYLVLFIHEQVGFSLVVSGSFLALAQFGGMISRISMGAISDILFKSVRKPMIIIDGIIIIISAIPFIFFSTDSPFWFVMVVSFFFGVSIMGWNAIMIALVMKLAGKEQQGAVIGLYFTVMSLGIFFYPTMFGFLVDLTGAYRISWVFIVFNVILAVLSISSVQEPKKID